MSNFPYAPEIRFDRWRFSREELKFFLEKHSDPDEGFATEGWGARMSDFDGWSVARTKEQAIEFLCFRGAQERDIRITEGNEA